MTYISHNSDFKKKQKTNKNKTDKNKVNYKKKATNSRLF